MRRPFLIIFIVLLILSFIYTNNNTLSTNYDNKEIEIIDVVKNKVEKEKYDEYEVGNFLVRDYTKQNGIKVGNNIKLKGKFKDLSKMSYEDFDYGRYIRSMGYEGLIYLNKYTIEGNNLIYKCIYNIKNYMSTLIIINL